MASYAMQAHHYNDSFDFGRGAYVSRKLNGHRGIFHGSSGEIYSLGRYSGSKKIHAPLWWLAKLPPIDLDGEIWHESDDLSYVKSIAGQGPEKSLVDPRWKELTFQAFDVRDQLRRWTERQVVLNRYLDNDVFKKVVQIPVACHADVEHYLDSLGPQAEGVMIAKTHGYYTYDRSHDILKYKRTYDAEANVTGAEQGEGKHLNRVGKINCKLTWDAKIATVKGGTPEMIHRTVTFNVGGGFTDPEREWTYYTDHLAGQTIKFSYLGVSQYGVPQSPNFLEVI